MESIDITVADEVLTALGRTNWKLESATISSQLKARGIDGAEHDLMRGFWETLSNSKLATLSYDFPDSQFGDSVWIDVIRLPSGTTVFALGSTSDAGSEGSIRLDIASPEQAAEEADSLFDVETSGADMEISEWDDESFEAEDYTTVIRTGLADLKAKWPG